MPAESCISATRIFPVEPGVVGIIDILLTAYLCTLALLVHRIRLSLGMLLVLGDPRNLVPVGILLQNRWANMGNSIEYKRKTSLVHTSNVFQFKITTSTYT